MQSPHGMLVVTAQFTERYCARTPRHTYTHTHHHLQRTNSVDAQVELESSQCQWTRQQKICWTKNRNNTTIYMETLDKGTTFRWIYSSLAAGFELITVSRFCRGNGMRTAVNERTNERTSCVLSRVQTLISQKVKLQLNSFIHFPL